ncbi:hypothetical protein [Marivirga lumbricoides]|uniref:hypothetical protein n=1 Tax=Marivirga lumbricoides TaxID=1046115 RepID=UPI0016628F5C
MAQESKKTAVADSIFLQSGNVLILEDTFYLPETDTVIFLPAGKTYKIKPSPYFKSDKFYDSLKSKAGNTQVTRMLFSLLFKSSSQNISNKKPITRGEAAFEPFEGKTIGAISLVKVPVLEGSVSDTSKVSKTWYGKMLNRVHMNTRNSIIKQNLLFKTGEEVDPFQMADNERILRQFRTIRDAKIYLLPRVDNPDIVDVKVVTQDVISLGGSLEYSSINDFNMSIYDRNILGYARDFQVSYYFDEHETPKHGYGLQYRVPNFWGSFIQGTFQYENAYFRKQISANLMRDFFTPEIKYGGGATLRRVSEYYQPLDTVFFEIPYTKNEASLWLGRSYQIMKRTNFIVQTRFSSTDYVERPKVTEDSNRYFLSTNMYFASLSLVKRTYSKSKLIRGFGRTEDVPKGKMLSLTYAFDNNEFYNRNYWQVKAGFAEYFKNVGYASANVGIGAYRYSNHWEDGVLNTYFNYFSPLIITGKSSFRQFVNVNYVRGINRKFEDVLVVDKNFETDHELRPLGKKRFNMTFESVYFAPWYFYGCKFSFYNRNSINWLSNDNLFDKDRLFSSFGAGVRILNESFVFPTIELNFTYYNSPGGYPNTTDLRLFNNYPGDFLEMQIGRPQVLPFNN